MPEGRESQWALVVGSPAPFDRIWAKFTRRLADVRFVIDSLGAEKPSGTPSLPPGRIAASFFSIDMENAAPRDVSAAAAIAFVEKSWLDANQVHKWSIEFDRFDERLNEWVPSPSKRIKEDDERVFFAVVLPGFSKFAIVGARELPPQRFEVGELRVSPDSPADGEVVQIGAGVTNTGDDRATYVAVLWIDSAIEAVQTLTLDAGQTAPLAFTVSRPAGNYSVRLDRRLGEFAVVAGDDGYYRVGLLVALGAAVLLVVAGGGYRLSRPRP